MYWASNDNGWNYEIYDSYTIISCVEDLKYHGETK